VVEENRTELEAATKEAHREYPRQLSAGSAGVRTPVEKSPCGSTMARPQSRRQSCSPLAQEHARALSEHGEASWKVELEIKGTGNKTLQAAGCAAQGHRRGLRGRLRRRDQLVQAQRATAWARGGSPGVLPHEIKNPLTTIQLSADAGDEVRARLGAEDAEALRRVRETSFKPGTASRTMVDDFPDYARLPPAELKRLDLNALWAGVALYENSRGRWRSSSAPSAELPPGGRWGTERQVIHNLVQNAQDSLENSTAERRAAADAAERSAALPNSAGDRVQARDLRQCGVPEEADGTHMRAIMSPPSREARARARIVKKIVDAHHGSVAIEESSEPGRLGAVCCLRRGGHRHGADLVVDDEVGIASAIGNSSRRRPRGLLAEALARRPGSGDDSRWRACRGASSRYSCAGEPEPRAARLGGDIRSVYECHSSSGSRRHCRTRIASLTRSPAVTVALRSAASSGGRSAVGILQRIWAFAPDGMTCQCAPRPHTGGTRAAEMLRHRHARVFVRAPEIATRR